MIVLHIVLLACFLTLLAFASATETSFFSLSSMRVRAFRQGRDPRGRIVAKMLTEPRQFLVTIIILNILINVLIQNVVSGIFGTLSGWFFTVGLPLVLSLFIGEVIPKSLALPNNSRVALIVARPVRLIAMILAPVRALLIPIASALSRVTFFFLKYRTRVSQAELKHALQATKAFGGLSAEEAKLLRGFLNLEDDVAKEIMLPRQEILYYKVDEPLAKLEELFVDKACSRVPVCKGELEEMVGILSALDYFLHREKIETGSDVKTYCNKPFYVPEGATGRRVLAQLFERGESMAIVVDEYGGIAGLITNEDLEEVVIGQIIDPRRDDESSFVRAGPDVIIATGKFELTEFEEVFEYHLESPGNMATIGGWLTEAMGDIPKEGQKYETDQFLFHVLAADQTKVNRVYIRKL